MRSAILVLAAVALCGEAAAQKMTDAQLAEAHCVHDGVKKLGRAGDLAESYLNEAAAQAVHDRAIDAVKTASASCKTKHTWSEEAASEAVNIAIVVTALERLETELTAAKVTAEVRSTMKAAVRAMPKADMGLFFAGTWQDDPALGAKVRKLAVEKGGPKDPKVLDRLLLWVETDAVAGSAMQRFGKDRFGL